MAMTVATSDSSYSSRLEARRSPLWKAQTQGFAMTRMFVLPPNLYVEILTPKDHGIRRWGFWEVLKS